MNLENYKERQRLLFEALHSPATKLLLTQNGCYHHKFLSHNNFTVSTSSASSPKSFYSSTVYSSLPFLNNTQNQNQKTVKEKNSLRNDTYNLSAFYFSSERSSTNYSTVFPSEMFHTKEATQESLQKSKEISHRSEANDIFSERCDQILQLKDEADDKSEKVFKKSNQEIVCNHEIEQKKEKSKKTREKLLKMANEINAPDMGPSEKVVLFTTLNFYNELCKEFSNRQFHKSDPSNRNQCVSNSSNDKNYIVEDDNSKLREQTDDDIDQLLEDNITKWKPDAFMLEHYFQDQEYEVDGKMISKIAELRKEDMLNEWKNEDYNFASFCGQTHKRERAEYDDERSCILQDADETEIDISNWKRRKEIIQKQIKEAKHYKSLFGKWVRKGWIVDAKEAEMWDEAEKKLKMKEMMEKDGVAEEKTGKKTLEEMKTKLVECEERTDCQEEIEALRLQIQRKEEGFLKKRKKENMSEFDYYWSQTEKERAELLKKRMKHYIHQKEADEIKIKGSFGEENHFSEDIRSNCFGTGTSPLSLDLSNLQLDPSSNNDIQFIQTEPEKQENVALQFTSLVQTSSHMPSKLMNDTFSMKGLEASDLINLKHSSFFHQSPSYHHILSTTNSWNSFHSFGKPSELSALQPTFGACSLSNLKDNYLQIKSNLRERCSVSVSSLASTDSLSYLDNSFLCEINDNLEFKMSCSPVIYAETAEVGVPLRKQHIILDTEEWKLRFKDEELNPHRLGRLKKSGLNVTRTLEKIEYLMRELVAACHLIFPFICNPLFQKCSSPHSLNNDENLLQLTNVRCNYTNVLPNWNNTFKIAQERERKQKLFRENSNVLHKEIFKK